MRLEDVRVGTVLVADGSFTCLPPRARRIVQIDDKAGPFIECADGKHFLDGQTDGADKLVGLKPSISVRAVWKELIPIRDIQTVRLPPGAEILSVAAQGHAIVTDDRRFPLLSLWFRCDPDTPTPTAPRRIQICGTGHPTAPDDTEATFIGTVILDEGKLVFHVFERTAP